MLEVQCKVSTVSDGLGCHVICWCCPLSVLVRPPMCISSFLNSRLFLIHLHLSDAFIQSDLQCIQVIHVLNACSLNPQPFVLLTQCSTTEPKERYNIIIAVIYERKAERFMVGFFRYPITVKRYIMAARMQAVAIGGHFCYSGNWYLVVSVCYLPNKW